MVAPSVAEGEHHPIPLLMARHLEGGVGIGVVAGVAHQIVENRAILSGSHTARSSGSSDSRQSIPCCLSTGSNSLQICSSIRFRSVSRFSSSRWLRLNQVISKKLVDQILQPLRLVQRHPGIAGAHLGGQLGLVPQQGSDSR